MIAKQEITNFILKSLTKYYKNLSSLKALSPSQFCQLVAKEQQDIVNTFNLTDVKIRRLEENHIEKYIKDIKETQGGRFFLRHGEQDSGDEVNSLTSETQKKIIRMQAKHNMNDPITLNSLIEFVATLLTMAYIRAKTGYTFKIFSSANLRAKEPAELLAHCLDAELNLSASLNCINYPSEEKLPYKKLTQLLKDGNLPWNSDMVNAVILDEDKPYERITREMRDIAYSLSSVSCVEVYITHSQQISAISQYAKLSVDRLSCYGFLLQAGNKFVDSLEGFYNKNLSHLISTSSKSNANFEATPFWKGTSPLNNLKEDESQKSLQSTLNL